MACANGCSAGACKPATCTLGAWTAGTVDPGTDLGQYGMLALDAQGGLRAAYYDNTNHILKLAYRPAGGSWTTSVIDNTADAGMGSWIAVDASGGTHVAYFEQTHGKVRYAHQASPAGSWSIEEQIESDQAWAPSIAVDPQGGIVMSYFDTTAGSLKVAYRPAAGAWGTTVVDSNAFDKTRMEFDSQWMTSLVLDSRGGRHIAYYDYIHGAIQYAYQPAGGAWSHSTIDAVGSFGGAPSLTIDRQDGLHVAYHHGTAASTGELKYAYLPLGGTWTTKVVDSSANAGRYSSIALDAQGGLHIVYNDGSILKYADRPSGGAWTTGTLENLNETPFTESLVVDPSGALHTVFYHFTTQTFKYADRPCAP
jgi:hypothetical protein